MQEIINLNGITKIFISRINYIELLAGASINAKTSTRKFLQQFEVLEFGKEAANIANNLSMRYRIGAKQGKDFLIAATCIANKIPILTENNKDYTFDELEVISY